jgi:tRNA (guanine-N7-)-methyltransferase
VLFPDQVPMAEDNKTPGRDLKFYGRKKGVRLSARQAGLMETLLPNIRLDIENLPLSGDAEIWLEIGFGGGEHLAFQARTRPQIQFIGAEPFVNGVAKLLVAVEEGPLSNISIYDGDARLLLEKIPDQSLSRIFLLYPDPWHKQRHKKRRFVNEVSIGHFHRILKPGGVFRFASDIEDYVDWTVKNVTMHGGFDWQGQRVEDWRQAPDDWQQTRYEAKALREGRTPSYIDFSRK